MRFAILGSGTGSNAETILREWKAGKLGKAEPAVIFSDKPGARILTLGETYGVPARFLDPGPFKTKLTPEVEAAYVRAIKDTGAEIVVLAGFMRVIKDTFLNAFPKQIINLHPSLLPSFKGLNGIKQAFDYGVKVTGCTVHYVTGELDGGPIIDQQVVRIEENDSLESLEQKIHVAEHQLLPAVLKMLAEGSCS